MILYNHFISMNFTNSAAENNGRQQEPLVRSPLAPLLLVQLHREECDNILSAVPAPHLTTASYVSLGVYQAVFTSADFILL